MLSNRDDYFESPISSCQGCVDQSQDFFNYNSDVSMIFEQTIHFSSLLIESIVPNYDN